MLFALAFLSLIAIVVLHELGHFFAAKKFGVKVEELGVGLPPRLFGIQRGETIYSLNLLPLGAFVRLEGEENEVQGPRSYRSKPIWQRAVIVAAGVVAFWIISAIIFGVLGATSGVPMQVTDEQEGVTDARVQIVGIAEGSPAAEAGVELGDFIVSIAGHEVSTVTNVQGSIAARTGAETTLQLERIGESVELSLTPRVSPPEGEGAVGVALVRTALVQHSWLEAPIRGSATSIRLTGTIIAGFWEILTSVQGGEGVPEGTQFIGPLGIVDTLKNSFTLGISYYFYFLALLSIYLAIFNALPIPVVDGGRLLFLGVEAVRRKPLPENIERSMNNVVFGALLILMIWVTIKDVIRIF